MWDAVTGTLDNTLQGHTDSVNSVAFNHDGSKIVSGSRDNTVRVWDMVTGALDNTLQGHTDVVHSVAFNHDGTQIVSGSSDDTVRVWDTDKGILENTIQAGPQSTCARRRRYGVNSVAFNHDGTKIVAGMEDHKIRILNDVKTRTKQRALIHSNELLEFGQRFERLENTMDNEEFMNLKKSMKDGGIEWNSSSSSESDGNDSKKMGEPQTKKPGGTSGGTKNCRKRSSRCKRLSRSSRCKRLFRSSRCKRLSRSSRRKRLFRSSRRKTTHK